MGLAIFEKNSGKLVFWAIGKTARTVGPNEVSKEYNEKPEYDFDTHYFDFQSMEVVERSPSDIRKQTYIDKRRVAYPAFGNQFDVIWKFLSTQELDAETQDMLDAINKVKSDFPKN